MKSTSEYCPETRFYREYDLISMEIFNKTLIIGWKKSSLGIKILNQCRDKVWLTSGVDNDKLIKISFRKKYLRIHKFTNKLKKIR